MHALLMGLISGYFFAATAPLYWSGARLLQLGSFLVLLLTVHAILRRLAVYREYAAPAKTLVVFCLGATVSCGFLGSFLHKWQDDAQTPIDGKSGCKTFVTPQLVRLAVFGLPTQTLDGSRFDALVRDIHPGCRQLLGQRLRVYWRGGSQPVAGQLLLAEVRLRQVRGSVSLGAFDYELHLARKGVRYGAYVTRVLSVTDTHRIGAGVVARMRTATRRALEGLPLDNHGVLLALLTGDSSLLSRGRWDLLQATGTVHLLVISGLHVGLLAGALLLGVRGAMRVPTLLWRAVNPALLRWFEAIVTLGLLCGYVLFVGSGVAAMRAVAMLGVLLLAKASGRQVFPAALLVLVLGVVVGFEPDAGMSPGFWLSFGLVAWLLLRERAAQPRSRSIGSLCRAVLMMHVGCSLVLVPVLAWLGLPIATISPIANLLAVPVVTLLLVPLVLLGGLLLLHSSHLGGLIFSLADSVAGGVIVGLTWLAALTPDAEMPALTGFGYLAAGSLIVAALLPTPMALRSCAVLAVVIAVSWSSFEPRWPKSVVSGSAISKPGEFSVSLLDVGQGLAVLVQTRTQTLLYDTGASFPSGFNFADAVISPALRSKGVKALDVLMISHHDLDHAGSLAQIVTRFNPRQRIGTLAGAGCGTGRLAVDWRVDGVRFEVLENVDALTSNNRSCVLVIRGDKKSAVIAGDIEASSERALLSVLPRRVDLLVVPHHGSRTSSTVEFVNWLRPRLALVSAGFGNRFGHPHDEVVARYERVGTCVLSTADLGTIEWRSQDEALATRSARSERRYLWQLGAALLIKKNQRAPEQCFAGGEGR